MIEETRLNTANLQQQRDQGASQSTGQVVLRERAYRDVPGLRHDTKDVLKQLQANIDHLEELGGRLGFMLSEVRSLIRR
jgi:hypothetical protein